MYPRMYTSTFYHMLPLYIFLNILWIKLQLSVPNFQIKYIIFHNCKKTEIRSKLSFERATEDEIKKLILSSSSKSCDLDPIPTNVLKYCLDILVTPITDIINISMDTSTFPKKIKEAHVCILLEFHFQNLKKVSSRLAARSY